MKKLILLFNILLVAATGFSQEKMKVNLKGGVIQAGMRGDAVSGFENLLDFTDGAITSHKRNGIFLGGAAQLPVSTSFSIEPGIQFAQKGYELKGALNVKGAEFLGVGARAQLLSQYIDLPVLAKAHLSNFSVFAGPQISYLLSADVQVRADAFGFNFLQKSFDIKNEMSQWDVALTGGIGYQFGNGLNVTAAYDHGLSRVNAGNNLEAYNQAIRLGVGYQF